MNIDALLKLVDTPRDNAMLRLTLARLLAAADRPDEAESHLLAALEMDKNYTAAWKELGRVRKQNDDLPGAAEAWRSGIETARANGDKQAEKEMTVFLKRIV